MKDYLPKIVSAIAAVALSTVAVGCDTETTQANPGTSPPDNIGSPGEIERPPNPTASINLDKLPNGTYFYGEASEPREGGAEYAAFRKIGDTLEGVKYTYQTDDISCFRGRAAQERIRQATIASLNPGSFGPNESNEPTWLYSHNETIDISDYQRLNADNIPPSVDEELANCRQLDYTARGQL